MGEEHRSRCAAAPAWRIPPVPRRPIGERAMTGAERQARSHARKQEKVVRFREALQRIMEVRTAKEARAIAEEALGDELQEN